MADDPSFCMATNTSAWAVGTLATSGQFRIRKVVWGRLMAEVEKRPGEEIRRAKVLVRRKSYGAAKCTKAKDARAKGSAGGGDRRDECVGTKGPSAIEADRMV